MLVHMHVFMHAGLYGVIISCNTVTCGAEILPSSASPLLKQCMFLH